MNPRLVALLLFIVFFNCGRGAARTTIDVRTNKPIEVEDILRVNDGGCFSAQYSVRIGRLQERDKEWLRSILNYANSYSGRNMFSAQEKPMMKSVMDSDMSSLISNSSFTHWAGPDLIRAIRDMSSDRLRLSMPANMKDPRLTKKYDSAQRHLIGLVSEKFGVVEEVETAEGCY